METIQYSTETKANKEHRCDFCDGKIGVGDTYLKSIHKMDGDIYDWKIHKYCSDLAEKLKMYDHADEGVTQEMFMETVSSEHDHILIRMFPENEIMKYSDIIQQLRRVRWRDKLSYVLRHFAKLEKALTNSNTNP